MLADNLSDPGNVARDTGIDARTVGLAAWEVAPGDDAVEGPVAEQGSSGVPLSGRQDREVSERWGDLQGGVAHIETKRTHFLGLA